MPRPETPNLPVPTAPAVGRTRPGPRRATPTAAYVEAQQEARRGLREGQGAVDRARRAYLETQWSGEDDRRPEPGLVTRTRL